ncbi:DUF1538 domain-containing protein [Pseudemcibacter aquimaris]|uniref:DUF1538 domain-containing protein n=1 Tax=Pseudemcibacter aquimaris TaxID=2857064 RepID=UPI00201323EB|nr:DUF1538 domain-containing protein [Pseudemcibacter aquimaris]MCC3861784.1 DUF1538 domain-containing protein [Pseudemcibacter aquimaris]WDU58539.1 DUF1538 domain-containing protein [Pseudemcibacter aquimaris]
MPQFFKTLVDALRDLAPIVGVVLFFQLIVLQQPLPEPFKIAGGMAAVVVGLALFIQGLELSLFPLGENMAGALVRKGSIPWLIIFSFALGFGTTVAEPALIAVSQEAARITASAGMIPATEEAQSSYAFGLRMTVAVSVGIAIVTGVIRIIKGWPIQYIIIGGYLVIVVLTQFAPESIIGVAYDSGGVTTSTITVPLVTALGIGLSTVIKGRNPMIDGFGLIAFASLFPIAFVLVYGIVF